MTTIRVTLPPHVRTLAKIEGELELDVADPPTVTTVLDALEARYPMLRGTIRDYETKERRAYIRFFACGRDLSHEASDELLPDSVKSGTEPLWVVGAIAGG